MNALGITLKFDAALAEEAEAVGETVQTAHKKK